MNFLAKIHATNMKKQILNHPHKPKNALLIKALMLETGYNHQIK